MISCIASIVFKAKKPFIKAIFSRHQSKEILQTNREREIMLKHLPNWLRTEDWVMGAFRSQDVGVVVVVVVELLLFCWEVNWPKPGDFSWSKIWVPVEFANLEDPRSPKPEQRTADCQKTREQNKKIKTNKGREKWS